MKSVRLGTWAASLAEQSCLAALIATPLFFDVYSIRIFEEDKVLLLRCITSLTAFGLIVWKLSAPSNDAQPRVWRVPLVVSVLGLMAAVLLSTACSIAPWTSFWGAYLRLQGAYTWLCYFVTFFA